MGEQCHRSIPSAAGRQRAVRQDSYRRGTVVVSPSAARTTGAEAQSTIWLQAHVEQWIDFSTVEVDAPLCSWIYPLKYPGHFPYDKKARPMQMLHPTPQP